MSERASLVMSKIAFIPSLAFLNYQGNLRKHSGGKSETPSLNGWHGVLERDSGFPWKLAFSLKVTLSNPLVLLPQEILLRDLSSFSRWVLRSAC